MVEKSQKEMLYELHQAVIGIPENPEENGLIGAVKTLTVVVKEQNSRIGRTERTVSKIRGIGIGLSVVFTLAGVGLGVWLITGG